MAGTDIASAFAARTSYSSGRGYQFQWVPGELASNLQSVGGAVGPVPANAQLRNRLVGHDVSDVCDYRIVPLANGIHLWNQTAPQHYVGALFDVVGDTGLEPVTSSV